MRVRHPNAVRETDDDVDDRVTLGGDTYAVDGDDCVDVPERQAVAWADRYDLDVATIEVDAEADADSSDGDEGDDAACSRCGQSHDDGACWDLIDDGVCPWCDDYEGDHVGQHASSAHPGEWANYTDD